MTLGVQEPTGDLGARTTGPSAGQAALDEPSAAPPDPGAGTPAAGGSGGPGPRWFRFWLGAIVVAGAGLQWAVIDHTVATGGPRPEWTFTRLQAEALIRGYWFGNPFWRVPVTTFGKTAQVPVPSALHGPLPTLVVAAIHLFGATTVRAEMAAMALVFLVAVVVGGLAVRDLVGPRAGILAAAVLVSYPPLWGTPATQPVETVVLLVVCLLVWGCVRFWRSPDVRGAVELGFYLGLAAVARVDLVLLVVLVGLPIVVLVRGLTWGGRARCLLAMGALVVLVVGPWLGRNLQTFTATVYLSDDPGLVVGGANCPPTYAGALVGWTDPTCPGPQRLARAEAAGQPGDESVVTRAAGQDGRQYASHHEGQLAGVLAARLGRLWNVYRPIQQAQLEVAVGRPYDQSLAGLWYFYVLVPLAVVGAVVLRRRRALLFPLVALVVLSSVTALLAYGDARFRVEGDVALALLAAVALDALWSFLARRSGSGHRRPAHAAR